MRCLDTVILKGGYIDTSDPLSMGGRNGVNFNGGCLPVILAQILNFILLLF